MYPEIVITNEEQANAAQNWMNRIQKHIIHLQSMSKKSSVPVDGSLAISNQLIGYLESALTTYEEKKSNGQKIEVHETQASLPLTELGLDTSEEGEPEGASEVGEVTFDRFEEEIDDDLPSEGIQEREIEEDDIGEDSDQERF